MNDQELSKWLRNIYPVIEKELRDGATNVFDFSKSDRLTQLSFDPVQTLSAIDKNLDDVESKHLMHGYACWLSVSTQNAPLVAISAAYPHDVWCNHSAGVVKVFQPVRNTTNSSVHYQELKTLPVKSCINALVTNQHNKDVFAGGTFSGTLRTVRIFKLIFDQIKPTQGTCTFGSMKYGTMAGTYRSISPRRRSSVVLWEWRGWRHWVRTTNCWLVISMGLLYCGKWAKWSSKTKCKNEFGGGEEKKKQSLFAKWFLDSKSDHCTILVSLLCCRPLFQFRKMSSLLAQKMAELFCVRWHRIKVSEEKKEVFRFRLVTQSLFFYWRYE